MSTFRSGCPSLQRIFEHVVERCRQAGLVWGKELFFDTTKIRANADLESLTPVQSTPPLPLNLCRVSLWVTANLACALANMSNP